MAAKPPHKLRFAVLATDVVLFTVSDKRLQVLLIKVNTPPHFVNMWGLPGGLIAPEETAEEAAERHLKVKGGIGGAYLEQLYSFSAIHRDKRGRVVSLAFLGLVPPTRMQSRGADREVIWMPVTDMPKLAYDHGEMVEKAIERLRAKLSYTNIISNLLPSEFTLSELQLSYETILGHKLDKRNFRKKVLDLGLVKATGKMERGKANRPAALYAFRRKTMQEVEIL